MGRSSGRRGFVCLAFAVMALALCPAARAVIPPPDGAYPTENTAEGDSALFSLTTGFGNTGLGFHALYSNTTANENTAVGDSALSENTTGFLNTALGFGALENNTTGTQNVAAGDDALQKNLTGSFNTALGDDALQNNLASNNTATGASALQLTTTGNNNTATGEDAMESNTTGSRNAAFGADALLNSTTGSGNIALGDHAGSNLTTGSNNIDIGHLGVAGESAKIRIGTAGTHKATYIAGIRGTAVPGGATVYIDSNGQLGTAVVSSERFKEEIKPMDKASEAILALKPVTFRYKHDLDPAGIPQFGLIAEEVERVNPNLVGRDDEGKINSVRYEAINAMLLNEFLKQHRKMDEQQARITKQDGIIAQQQAEIKAISASVKEQASQIRKVRAEVAVSKAAPQLVSNQ